MIKFELLSWKLARLTQINHRKITSM